MTRHSVAGNAPNGNGSLMSLMLSRIASQSTVGYCTPPSRLADCSARSREAAVRERKDGLRASVESLWARLRREGSANAEEGCVARSGAGAAL